MCGAALALVIPGTAYATPVVTVTTSTPTTFTAPGNGALLQTSAQCSSGLIAGGGVNLVTTSGTTQQADDIHAMETAPSPNGSAEATGTDTNVVYWLGYGGTGGQGGGTYTVQPFGVCFTNSSITSTQIVVASNGGPNGANSSCLVVAHRSLRPAIEMSIWPQATPRTAAAWGPLTAAPTRPLGRCAG